MNRFSVLFGAARAAELTGNQSNARSLYERLAANCIPGTRRKEVRDARACLARKS